MLRGTGRGPEVYDHVPTTVDSTHRRLIAKTGPTRRGPGTGSARWHDSHKQSWAARSRWWRTQAMTSTTMPFGLFSQDDFTAEGATDPAQGPAGEPLMCRLATIERGTA